MNIFDNIRQQLNDIVKNKYDIIASQKQLSVELPKTPEHGDLSTNVAMLIAKQLSNSPIEIAEEIKVELEKIPYISKVTIAMPGFINLEINKNIWYETLKFILAKQDKYGDSSFGNNEPINIEFISTNPTGPMHIGHSRGGIYGDALTRLMSKCGYVVTKEFYINDAGSQIDTLTKSAYLRYLEACGEVVELGEGMYPGEYLIPVGSLCSIRMVMALKIWNW
jgi:arginyl-tRNA synthetase